MRIEYSLKNAPTNHIAIQNAICFIQNDKECIILREEGERIVLPDNEIEDFSWLAKSSGREDS